MNLIERAKNILISPAKEWNIIFNEEANVKKVLTGYVLPFSIITSLTAFIGYGFIGFKNMLGYQLKGIEWGFYYALLFFIVSVCTVYLTAFIVDRLALSFGSEKNFGRSFQLVTYSFTAYWVGGLFQILPSIDYLGTILGLYGLYILYIGLPKIKKTPADKQIGYFVVTFILLIAVYLLLGIIISAILQPIFGLSYGTDNFRIDNY